jgi:Spy/CpxP family protein refolding chaperone
MANERAGGRKERAMTFGRTMTAVLAWGILAAAACGGEWRKPEAMAPRPEGMGRSAEEGILFRLINNRKMAEHLGLREDQIGSLTEKGYDLRKETISLRAELELAALEQARLLTQENVDEKALMGAVEKTGEIRIRMAKIQIKNLLLVRKALTPEQYGRLRKMIQERAEEWSRKTPGRAGERWHERKGRGEEDAAPPDRERGGESED